MNNQKTDNDCQILILDVTINNVNFVLINLYNANTETEVKTNKKVSVLNNLFLLLEKFDVTLEKNLILAGDFNLFLNSKLDAKGGKPAIKKKSLPKLIHLKSHMIFVTYEELEIQSQVLSPSDKSILQVLFNLGLTIFLFPIVFTICK